MSMISDHTVAAWNREEQVTASANPRPGPVLAMRDSPAEWLAEALAKVQLLLTLPPNWDAEGASAIAPRSIAQAFSLLDALGRFVGVDRPTVTASRDGLAALCWDNGDRSLDLKIHPDGSAEFVLLSDDTADRDEVGVIDPADRDRLATMLTAW